MADSKQLQAYLNSLADKIGDRASQTVLEQAGRLSFAQRQALQSVEQTAPTHDLENSCTVVPGKDGEVIVQAGGELTTKDGFDYATAFEWGDSHQPARPFFYSTYNAMKDDIQQAIQDAISEELK